MTMPDTTESLREQFENWDAGSHQCEGDCKCDWYVINGTRFFLCTEKQKKFDELMSIVKQHDQLVIGEDDEYKQTDTPDYLFYATRNGLRQIQRARATASYEGGA